MYTAANKAWLLIEDKKVRVLNKKKLPYRKLIIKVHTKMSEQKIQYNLTQRFCYESVVYYILNYLNTNIEQIIQNYLYKAKKYKLFKNK